MRRRSSLGHALRSSREDRRYAPGKVLLLLGDSVLAWAAVAYFVAAIPVGVVVAKARGIDLRTHGSGNIGATNAARVLGSKWGAIVLVLDTIKAALPVYLASQPAALGGLPDAATPLAVVGLAAVLGHIFPIYLGFRGGKGVACALGVFLAIDPPIAGAALVMYVQGLVLTRTSALGSLSAVTAAVLLMVIGGRPFPYQALTVAIAVIIWIRHIGNLRLLLEEAKERKQARAERFADDDE